MTAGTLHALILSALFAVVGHVAIEQLQQGKDIAKLLVIVKTVETSNQKRTDRYEFSKPHS